MSLQTTISSTTINVFCLGLYWYGRSKSLPSNAVSSHLTGIALTSLLHGTRSYSEPYLKERFGEKNYDLLYLSASLAIMGAANTKLPTKTNVIASCIFGGIQLASHKIASSFFQEIEPGPPPSISAEKLSKYRANSYETGSYLTDQLFPRTSQTPEGSILYSVYLYLMPEGFMITLCDNGDNPFFLHLPTIDGTGVQRMRRIERITLPLSQATHQYIQEYAKKVRVQDQHGNFSDQEWTLEGIPPLICIEGKWNETPLPLGTHVQWDSLIQNDAIQKHEAFELHLVHPIWKYNRQTPNLRGMCYKHSKSGFDLWVHEKNTNAYQNDRDKTASDLEQLESTLQFLRNFDQAAYTFGNPGALPRDRGNNINYGLLENWANLTQQIPFHVEENPYENLTELVREFRRNQTPDREAALQERFQAFFQNLPGEAHFTAGASLHESFTLAQEAFHQNGNNLIRDQRGFIIPERLREWLKMAKMAQYFFNINPPPQVIADAEEYLQLNDDLRLRRGTPEQQQQWGPRRTALDPILIRGFQQFFHQQQDLVRTKGRIFYDFSDSIRRIQERHDTQAKRIPYYQFCEQERQDFDPSTLLLQADGSIDPEKLLECREVVELLRFEDEVMARGILDKCERYKCILTTNAPNADQDLAHLSPQVIADLTWFFNVFAFNLEPTKKERFLRDLAKWAKCPRSHSESTAQIKLEVPPSVQDLLLVLREGRANQTLSQVRMIDSHVKHSNSLEMSDTFFQEFQTFYQRVEEFVRRKAQGYKLEVDYEWVYVEERMEQQRVVTVSDGTEYRFPPCDQRDSRSLFGRLTDIQVNLASLYTDVDQTNRETYLSSPMPEEEVEILDTFYAVANHMIQELDIPVDLFYHSALHKSANMMKRARGALTNPERYQIYKRIGNEGGAMLDIVRRGDHSDLETLNDTHNAIYYAY